jgi:hypothetical protein
MLLDYPPFNVLIRTRHIGLLYIANLRRQLSNSGEPKFSNGFVISRFTKYGFTFLSIFLLITSFTYGQNIPKEYKKTVVFIFVKDDNDSIVPNGTGFFIGKSDSIDNLEFCYLVTAKHVIQYPKSNRFYDSIYIRIDKSDSNYDTIPIQLIAQKKYLQFVSDEYPGIDIAVIPLMPDIKR